MRILILSDDFPPQSFGGAGFSTFYLAHGLQKAGHQVFVITTCREKSNAGTVNYQGLRVFRIFTNYHERWRGYLSLYNPQAVKKVREIIKQINPDIVHANNIHSYLSYRCLKIAKKFEKPVFFTARDAMAFNYSKLATKRYLEKLDCKTIWLDHLKQAKKGYNPLRNILIKRYLGYVDQIFAISQALKEAFNQNDIKNVGVSYTGIDVNDWQVSSEEIEKFKEKHNLQGKRVIFFGGRVSGLKGLEQINQAVAKVKEEIPATVLLIAGSKGIGWLSGDELRAAYSCADIVVVPSVYLDPFPRNNLEAMASKKPVIATKYGGSPEIVVDGVTGYIVNPLKVNELADKLLDLLKNPSKARQFGQAGYERIKENFSLEKHVKQTLNVYEYSLKNLKRISWWQNFVTIMAILPFMVINSIILLIDKITRK